MSRVRDELIPAQEADGKKYDATAAGTAVVPVTPVTPVPVTAQTVANTNNTVSNSPVPDADESPDARILSNTQYRTFLDELGKGTNYVDAYRAASPNPQMSEAEIKKAKKHQIAKSSIAALGDGLRLLGQGLAAKEGGIVNRDTTSVSGAAQSRYEKQMAEYNQKLREYRAGLQAAQAQDSTSRKEYLKTKLSLHSQGLADAEAKAKREAEKETFEKKMKQASDEAELQRKFTEGENEKSRKNALKIAELNAATGITKTKISANSRGSSSKPKYTEIPDGKGGLLKIPTVALNQPLLMGQLYDTIVSENPGLEARGEAILDKRKRPTGQYKKPAQKDIMQIVAQYYTQSPSAIKLLEQYDEGSSGTAENSLIKIPGYQKFKK